MNWQQWDKAKALLDEVGVTALLGVIPNCQDPDLLIDKPRPDFWAYIKELQKQGYAIAMHGYQHVFDINAKGIVTKKHPTMNHSEFAGHPYEIQYQKLKKGKDIFLKHGIDTDVFFAPAHSYDDNTLKALAANGFKYISDGKSCKPYMRNGIICLPARSSGIPRIRFGGYYTAVLHAHEWVKDEKKQAWNKFQKLCMDDRITIVSFNEYKFRSLGVFVNQYLIEKVYIIWERCLRPFVRKLWFIRHLE
ncbi:MAG: DUF2334 domain-containing protein [Bacteroidaceae bacterium]|nr:DUF2334 domain-containing protein [Bacteroidaceae bacterium]